MNEGVVLLYNADTQREKEIRTLCLRCGIRVNTVPASLFGLPLRELLPAGQAAAAQMVPTAAQDSFSEEMMVICGLTRPKLMLFLDEFKKQGIRPVALKAVLTEHNQAWDSVTLYQEISREHAFMHGKAVPEANG